MNQDERKERLKRRNEKIRIKYGKLSSKKLRKARLYSHEAVLEMLSDQFDLAVSTIDDIVCNRSKY
jgi:hypothetical protein